MTDISTDIAFDDGHMIVTRTQDVESILEDNKARHADWGHRRAGDLKHVAQIPLVLAAKWLDEEGVNILQPGNEDFLRCKLNDPEYAYLRTAPGRL